MNHITIGSIISLLVVAAALAWTTDHYHGNAVKYKEQRDTATHNLKLANEMIDDMQIRQRDVAALDARYTKELADAKAENDALRDDVAAGRRRLHVNATCPTVVRKATATPGVDNAGRPRLADSAQRDYFTLRDRVKTMQKQLEGAQQYILEQCEK
ncbi:lysis protein [Salmonella enterica]|uniref:lysis protein n=1 Tax=Salmonella enterica TaxID=28901 RepID=UPI0003BD7FCC|nr:lysis protein [Salmonella enterica]ESJ21364.1 Phage outer membrane lytic protein Rz, Endopeptidase [Salmonella enterica subsp. diarizonae serovar 60:r:e,n,x,z15 str. 01-0170]EDX6844803.1 lysis protein [Salmonella enterica]EIQ9372619.1 lysis protein [Salmonella enterica]EJP0617792.1 lysis protein [Salmonella enterica]EJW1071522.1 lysis protein [Salmonella enterica]